MPTRAIDHIDLAIAAADVDEVDDAYQRCLEAGARITQPEEDLGRRPPAPGDGRAVDAGAPRGGHWRGDGAGPASHRAPG